MLGKLSIPFVALLSLSSPSCTEEVFSGVLPLLTIEGTEICSLRDTHSPKSKLALVELLRMHGTVLSRRRRWDEAECLRGVGIAVVRSVRYPYAEARPLLVGSDVC
jgi:hypothetical protein